MTMNPFELAKELMRIPSVTGAEGEVGRYLNSFLNQQGFRVETQEVTPGRSSGYEKNGRVSQQEDAPESISK